MSGDGQSYLGICRYDSATGDWSSTCEQVSDQVPVPVDAASLRMASADVKSARADVRELAKECQRLRDTEMPCVTDGVFDGGHDCEAVLEAEVRTARELEEAEDEVDRLQAEVERLRRDRHEWKMRLKQKHRLWLEMAAKALNIAMDRAALYVELRERCEATDALVVAVRDMRHGCGVEPSTFCDDCVQDPVCTAYAQFCYIEDFYDEHPIFCDDPYDCSTCCADEDLDDEDPDDDEELPSSCRADEDLDDGEELPS